MGVPIDRGLTQGFWFSRTVSIAVEMGVPIDRGLTQWFLLYGIESHVEEVEMGVPIDRGLTLIDTGNKNA